MAWAASILLTAFVIICIHAGTAWPWTHVVHEDGRRTLIETILYFEHATRELPLDVILGIAIGGSMVFAFAPDARRVDRASSTWRVSALALLTAIILAVILIGTAAKGGMGLVLEELLQNRTRFGVPLEFGSHWRYHLLERIAMILLSLGFAGVLRIVFNGQYARTDQIGLAIVVGSIGIYIALTAVFSRGYLFFELKQPFRDPQYLGHQAREALTHGLVTVPIAWGVCMLMLSNWKTKSTFRIVPISIAIVGTMVAGVAGILLATYVCVAAFMAGAVSHGQTTDLVTLIFPHFFEHSFTYLVVPTVAALVYEITRRYVLSGSAGIGTVRAPEAS